MLAEKLPGEVTLVNVKNDEIPNLENYDRIIIGGSIYAGRIQKEIKKLCTDFSDLLRKKKPGVFICCGLKDRADKQLKEAFPEIYDHISVKGYFGYEMDFSRLNFFERLIVRVVSKTKESRSEILTENIEKFAREILKEN